MQGRVFECATATSRPSHAGSSGTAGPGGGGTTTATCVFFGARDGFVCGTAICVSCGFAASADLADDQEGHQDAALLAFSSSNRAFAKSA